MSTKRERDGAESSHQVHVRTLGVIDTLRWAWNVMIDRVELVGVTLVVTLLSVVSTTGISRPSPAARPEIASWVWPVFLAYFLCILVVWAVVYGTTRDAIEERSRPLGDRITDAVGHFPSLVATAILMWLVSGVVLFVPVFVGMFIGIFLFPYQMAWLVTIGALVLALPGVYLFHRLLLAYPAVVIDGNTPIESLKTSWSITGGGVLKVVAINVCYLVLVGLSNVVASVFGQYTLAGNIVASVGTAVLIPLFGLALGHLYLERSRNV